MTRRGARSRNCLATRVTHRSGGSLTCESAEISLYSAMRRPPGSMTRLVPALRSILYRHVAPLKPAFAGFPAGLRTRSDGEKFPAAGNFPVPVPVFVGFLHS